MILAIDPGERAGWAVIDGDGKLGHSSAGDGASVESVNTVLRCAPDDCDYIICEDQFFRRATEKQLKTQLYRRHLWEIIGQILDYVILPAVNPATWQSYFKLKRGDKAGMIKLVKLLTGHEAVEDEADAILIGLWAHDKYRRG